MGLGNKLLLTLNLALLGVAVWYIVTRGGEEPPARITYIELLTISLTVVTVVLGAVAIFAALAAIWGRNEIVKSATRIAERVAQSAAKNRIDTALIKIVDERIDERITGFGILKDIFPEDEPGGGEEIADIWPWDEEEPDEPSDERS